MSRRRHKRRGRSSYSSRDGSNSTTSGNNSDDEHDGNTYTLLLLLLYSNSLSKEQMETFYQRDPPQILKNCPFKLIPDGKPEMPSVDECPFPVPDPAACDPNAKYRTIDGTCNNLENPNWGSAFTPLVRFMAPDYEDGKWMV